MKFRLFLFVLLMLAATEVLAQRSGQSMTIQTGTVVGARSVDLQSNAGGGALVGGVAGYAMTSSRQSSRRRNRNALLGAATGAAIASGSQGSRNGMQYIVEIAPGNQITIVTDQTQVRIGDCVTVETSGSTSNIRRVSQTLCEPEQKEAVYEAVEEELREEADMCLQAKEQMMEAETMEALEIAKRRVQFLCDD